MPGKWIDRIFFMVLENHGWSSVQQCRFVDWFARNGTVFSKWTAITHPSGPNYRALVSGNIWVPGQEEIHLDKPNIGKTVDYTVMAYAGQPAFRHNPFLDLNPGSNRPLPCVTSSLYDLKDPIVYLGLDDFHNAHSASLDDADKVAMQAIWSFTGLSTPRSAFFLVFDEAYGEEFFSNHVFAGIVGPGLPRCKIIQEPLNHYDFAAFLYRNFGVPLHESFDEYAMKREEKAPWEWT